VSRPSIPAEIQRRVLVECGYRCAIPQCGNPQVDLHHIIPWHQCKEHSADNLIPLCPNCHRRADNGEIDRKALLIYKLRAQRIFCNESTETIGSLDPWTTRTFHESDPVLGTDIQLEYPHFPSNEYKWAEEVNSLIQSAALSEAQGIRNVANEAPWTLASIELNEGESTLAGSYEVVFFQPPFLSVRLTFWAYHHGAAHPNNWTKTKNLYLTPVCDIELEHFFPSKSEFLDSVSLAVRERLLKLENSENSDDISSWIIEGTQPVKSHFSRFNYTQCSLIFSFDEYQVGPYSAGRQDVVLPFGELSGIIVPSQLQGPKK
jgi:hypothetical protein